MTIKYATTSSWMLAPAVVLAACAGTKLNDVGDIPGGAAGSPAASPGKGGSKSTTSPQGGANAGTPGLTEGGTGGDIEEPPVEGGAGGEPPLLELECPSCEVIAAAPDIRAVATGAETVFWLEYGTEDDLGNHQDDGRLMALPFAGGEPTVLSSILQGPIELAVSADYAYVVVEQSGAPSGSTQLLRVTTTGAEPALVQALPDDLGGTVLEPVTDWFRRFFVEHGGVAFWANEGTIYRLAEDSAGPPEVFLETEGVFNLAGDSSQLYLYDNEGIKKLSYEGGDPVLLRALAPVNGFPAYPLFTLDGGFFYAFEPAESYLVRMPITGGNWERLVTTEQPSQLLVDGDSYFHDVSYRPRRGNPIGCSLQQGSLLELAPLVTLARSPFWSGNAYWRAWDVSATALFFGWEDQLYRTARADE